MTEADRSIPVIIDTKMHGRDGITACFLYREERTLVETGPKTSLPNVVKGLEEAGVDSLDKIVVTHIHLDHAGAAGALCRRFPNARVYVHEVGAPHLIDPSKLWSSASRIYGDQMEQLWGGADPIDADRVIALSDGGEIDLGGRTLTAVETPGHAYHHHAYVDSFTGIAFTGDALGVRLPEIGLVRPATPPPEFHLEKAIASIERIRSLGAAAVWLTHFGPQDAGPAPHSVSEVCDEAIDALMAWARWVEEARKDTRELDEAAKRVEAEARAAMESKVDESAVDRMEQTTSFWMNTWGYMRYFDKQEAAT
ncbi:MAG: MBL fold metallo-hydrolase [Actinomycetota bacterium]|nr:MBL fold metallo-hydrolase [Actinomycetota bacterium]